MTETDASSATEGVAAAAEGSAEPVASRSLPRILLERLRQNLADPGTLLAIVLIAALVVRLAWLKLPRDP